MYGINKSFILSIALLVLSTGLSSLSLLRANKDTVVTVNKEQIVTQFAKELNSRSLSHERAQTLSKRFAKALKLSIESFAKDKKVVVLDSKSVLGSGADISSQIMERVIVTMRGGK